MYSDTQNDLLLNKLMEFYNINDNLEKMLKIINGESKISLRIVDWFVTNFSKKNYIVYDIKFDFMFICLSRCLCNLQKQNIMN